MALLVAFAAGCGGPPEPQTAGTSAGTSTPARPTTVDTAVNPPEPSVEQRKASAKAAMDARDWTRAKGELEAVVGKNPNDVEAWKWLGDIRANEGDARGATEAFYAASKADRGKDEALALTAAQGLYGQKRYDDLVGLMGMATKENPGSMAAWMWLALGQSAKGDWTGASESYGRLVQSFPDEPALWAEYACAQAATGKNDEAKKSAKAALDKWTEARAPKSNKDVKLGKGARELATIARAMRRAGDPAGALAALTKFNVPKDETAPILDVERGLAKRAKKDGAGAKADAEKAMRAGGENFAPGHILLAALAVDASKPDEAKAHLAAWSTYAGGDTSYALEVKQILDAMSAPAATPDAGKKKKSG